MCSKLADVMYVDREQLRLLSDPLRRRMLELLAIQEMSTSRLSAELGDGAPRNLYYHVNRLHEAGLIRLVRTEPRRGTVEKFYEAVAKVFAVKPELVVTMATDQATRDDVMAAARRVVEDTLHQFATSVARGLFTASAERIPPVVAGITIRGTEDRLREIGKRLRGWVADVSAEPEMVSEAEYAGLVMFFPTELPHRADGASSQTADGS